MSVEDKINERRKRIIELKINESSKENMLRVFDKTVSMYKGKKEEKEIAKAIAETAKFTRSEKAVIEVAKTLALYYDKEEAEEVAEAITHAGFQTKSEEAVIETAKTLRLCYNKKEAEKIAESIVLWTQSGEKTKKIAEIFRLEEIIKTVKLYQNEMIIEAIRMTANYTQSEEAAIETAKTLQLYHDKKGAEKVTRAIERVAHFTESKEAIIETAKKLRETKDIYNIDSTLFYSYITHISDNISKNIKYSLSLKDINKITETYSLTMDFCKDEDEEFKYKVGKGFFYHLNKAIDTGKTIDDKLKIMNKWSDNVYTTFRDHPEDFMEFIR